MSEKSPSTDDKHHHGDDVPELVASATTSLEELAAFGSKLEFTPEEEKKLLHALDWRILPVVTILYMANFIDRTNIGNAKVGGLEKDLGLVGYQYNIGLSVFFVAYALTEIPSNLLLKRFGASRWIPSLCLAFGLVSLCTAFITNFGGFMVVRICLGLAEGGMMPGITYYLSTFYKRHELAFRVGIFVCGASMAGAFGGLLASAFLAIPQLPHLPHGRWRNIFLIEGILTILLAIMGYFLLPDSPETTPFLTERQRLIAAERLRVESAGLKTAEKTDMKLVKRAWTNMSNWVCAIGFFLCNITVQGISLFMPTLLSGMGYTTIQSQLRSVPPYVVASIWSLGISYAAWKTGKRGLWVIVSTPLAIMGSALLVGTANHKAGYAGLFFITMGVFPCGHLFLTWGSNNSAPYTTRAVSSAMIVGLGSFGPIVSAWAYLPKDRPRYVTGNSIALGAQVLMLLCALFLVLWNLRENRLRKQGKRDWRLDADKETIEKLGHLHPRFRLTI